MFLFDIHDLPPELIPHILVHLQRPSHLSSICSVSRDFYRESIPLLYEKIAIYAWHQDGKNKALKLIRTLADNQSLAKHVRILEIRDFPKTASRERSTEMARDCVKAIENCENLEACTWTRDGTLKDPVLDALSRRSKLHTLEINGHSTWNYDPALLLNFTHIQKLSVIMPGPGISLVLQDCVSRNRSTLQSFNIIGKETNEIWDGWLSSNADSLSSIRHLHLAGCPRVTQEGVLEVLRANTAGIRTLALEGISNRFDMKELASLSKRRSLLNSLQSISLAVSSTKITDDWLRELNLALSDSPLTHFHLYSVGGSISAIPLTENAESDFIHSFMLQHGRLLERFAVLRTPFRSQSLQAVAQMGSALKQLFVSMWKKDLSVLGSIVSSSRTIRNVHVTYAYNSLSSPSEVDDDSLIHDVDEGHGALDIGTPDSGQTSGTSLPTMAELNALVSQFGPQVVQFGLQSRVWQIRRIFNAHGEKTSVELAPYESIEVPDVFLVVRA